MAERTIQREADGSHELLIREVDTSLALLKADKANLAYALYRIMDSSPNREERSIVLAYICEHHGQIESSSEVEFEPVLTQNMVKELAELYGPIVDNSLRLLLQQRLSTDEFYMRLYDVIYNPLFRDENARAFALYWLLLDKRIPYFELQRGLRMSNEDWRNLGREIREQRARVRFILSMEWEQRSEEADLLLQEIQSLQGEAQVRLMGFALWQLRREGARDEIARLMDNL